MNDTAIEAADPAKVLDLSGHFPLLHLADGYELQTYFIVVSLALCLCVVLLVRRAEARGLARNLALDIAVTLIIFGMLGARLFHVFFEEPRYYFEDPLRVFELWRGGFVWYGGALLGALAAIGFVRYRRQPLGPWLDLFAPIAALGYAFGRVACFLTGCCYGSVCVLGSGFRFRHPTQLYAIIWELGVFFLLRRLESRRPQRLKPPGKLFLLWLVLHACGRIVMEIFRADPRGPEPLGVSLAIWISFLLILSAVGAETWGRFRPNCA